jgi:glycosyltransferase involved in cell wall biosynthesis
MALGSESVISRWIVFRERTNLRWGGDLRRHHIFAALATGTRSLDVDGWSVRRVAEGLASRRRWPWEGKPHVAAATMLTADALSLVAAKAVPSAVDFHDDPIAQNAALGVSADPAWTERVLERRRRNLDAFRWHVVPSAEMAGLAGLDMDRIIVAGNGSDTSVIRPMPWPDRPMIGLISGAAPGRGIETLLSAARLVRLELPDVRLLLWLAGTGDASKAYLAELQRVTRDEAWVEYGVAPYAEIGAQLGRATVQCVPSPNSAYWDAVSPIKLFDAMASARPVVVTPRTVMRAEVERHDAGLVAPGDKPEDLASVIARLLADQSLAQRLGANGREAVVAEHDWRTISVGLAARLDELE